METFAVASAQSQHVGNEMMEAAARNRLERSLRFEPRVEVRRQGLDWLRRFSGDQSVATLGFASDANLEWDAIRKLTRQSKQLSPVAVNEFQFHLAEIGRLMSVLYMAFVDTQLDVATVQFDRVDRPLHARFEERLQAAADLSG
jgi:hypothetical protein